MSRQRVPQLTRKHQDLDTRIRQEARSAASDDLALQALKRQKLRLKELIVAAEG